MFPDEFFDEFMMYYNQRYRINRNEMRFLNYIMYKKIQLKNTSKNINFARVREHTRYIRRRPHEITNWTFRNTGNSINSKCFRSGY